MALYRLMVMSPLEYYVQFLSPHFKKDKVELEKVQINQNY